MNLKNKFKKFFTLRPGAEDGFTLVELVVVIAILGILAAVATPALDKYIVAAKNAKDDAILGAVSSAFAAACVDGGFDVENVDTATIKVENQAVYGLSTLSVGNGVQADIGVVAKSFNEIYVTSNTGTTFSTPNVNSLVWNPSTSLFELSADQTSTLVVLSSGKVLSVSPEDMAKIQASAYDEMGASGITQAINNIGDSATSMASLAQSLGMMGKLTNVLVANKFATQETADGLTPEQAGNGLQLVTAKYLSNATEEQIMDLFDVDLHGSTYGMLIPLATGDGGTVTVSAAAAQYAVVEAFANSESMKDKVITLKVPTKTILGYPSGYKNVQMTVSDYLASDYAALDPVAALTAVQNTNEYKAYKETEQYTNDINGFVGTMSILGDNLGTIEPGNEGSININSYLDNGINSQDAQDALSAVLGK